MSINKKEEPKTAPKADQWYTLTLGSSFKDHPQQQQQPSSKFCTLRYEFKPASIDKSQGGLLHKSKDNKISVEFNNNQIGKPKVSFEGSSEDYKENDGVLFFDGQSLRLERLHRSVKRLRHVRLPGDSSVSASTLVVDPTSSPRGVGGAVKVQNSRPVFTPPQPQPLFVEVERIDIGDAGGSGGNPKNEKDASSPPTQPVVITSPESNEFNLEDHLEMDDDDDAFELGKSNSEEKMLRTGIDINLPHHDDVEDDEFADLDATDNGDMVQNAAEALRAQVNAVGIKENTSSTTTSSVSRSTSSSSESGDSSSSDSSDGDGDGDGDGDSVNSI